MSNFHTTTTNGALAHKNTGNQLVDLFFSIGAMRPSIANHSTKSYKDKADKSIARIEASDKFANALLNDPEYAAAILLWARDIRHGGAGEREVFKVLFGTLLEADENLAKKVLCNIPSVGRFDDLKVAYRTSLQDFALEIWATALKEKNVLAFKWADRSDVVLRTYMGFKNEAEFRKYLSAGRKDALVEQAMCSKNWATINYSKLPSVAGVRYANSFKKNDKDRYMSFLEDKDAKVNASVIYPHDVYRTFKYGENSEAASKIWENMPNLELKGNILTVADVSGSMDCKASGQITCLDISISLGAYIAQQCKGKFNNKLMTFSENPTLVTIPNSTDLKDVFSFIERMNWGGRTDFEKTYKSILDYACLFNVPKEEMPEILLVLSDMQFDHASTRQTHFGNMKAMFEAKGYNLPKIVFWNLNASYENVPVTHRDDGVCLVSGFSPNILKAILRADLDKFTPKAIMDEAITPFLDMLRKAA